MRRAPLLLLLGALAACGDDGASFDAGGRDARPPADAHILDAPGTDDGGGGIDSGAGLDGGSSDMCRSGGCDPRRPTDCPGGRCVLAGATTECRPLSGTGAEEGDPCMSAEECGSGLGCFVAGELSTCGRVCCPGMTDACGDGLACVRIARLVDGTLSTWGRCAPPRPCDVLDPELDCEEGEACYIVSELGDTDCLPEGRGSPGDGCEVQEDCMAGLFCGGVEGVVERTCIRICRLDGTVPCPVDEGMCRAYAHSPQGTGLCTRSRP